MLAESCWPIQNGKYCCCPWCPPGALEQWGRMGAEVGAGLPGEDVVLGAGGGSPAEAAGKRGC